MISRFIISLFSALVSFTAQAQASSQQTVYWYHNDFPPYYITSGDYKGKGLADRQLEIFRQQMPQFRHEHVSAPHDRALEMMKQHGNGCHTSLFKTPEREAIVDFSMPILENLPNGIITLRPRAEQFKPFLNKQGQLKLDSLLKESSYRVGIVGGRKFGVGIDTILRKSQNQKSVVTVSSNDGLSSRLLKLINQDEYDAVISYSYELQYAIRQLNLNPHDFVFFPIAEHASLQPIYVACSKSAFGREILSAVNRVLATPSARGEIEAAYRFWLDEAAAAQWDRLRVRSQSMN